MRIEKYGIGVAVALFLLVVSLVYVMYEISNRPPRPMITTDPPVASPTKPTQSGPETREQYVARIKREIIAGEREDVPEDINLTKERVVKEYFFECYSKPTRQEHFKCLDIYYRNNDLDFAARLANCGSDTTCIDDTYYDKAWDSVGAMCEGIKEDSLREQCVESII